jgi:hypothetical protein
MEIRDLEAGSFSEFKIFMKLPYIYITQNRLEMRKISGCN